MAKKNNLNAKNLLVYGGLAFIATKLFGKSNKSTAPVYDPTAPVTADYTRTSETNLRDPNEIESSTATFVGGIRRKRNC
jgi:hypothetical protein